jgi:hypothetical protein
LVVVLNSPDAADAVLTGATEMDKKKLFPNVPFTGGLLRGSPKYSADCVVRLIGRNNQVLWTDESTAGKFPGTSRSMRGVSSSAGERMSKSLVDAIIADRKNKTGSWQP